MIVIGNLIPILPTVVGAGVLGHATSHLLLSFHFKNYVLSFSIYFWLTNSSFCPLKYDKSKDKSSPYLIFSCAVGFLKSNGFFFLNSKLNAELL